MEFEKCAIMSGFRRSGHNYSCTPPIILKLYLQPPYYSGIILAQLVTY